MNNLDFQELGDLFCQLKGHRCLIFTHIRPDGDALGSIFGLVTILRENQVNADFLLTGILPDYAKEFMPQGRFFTQSEIKGNDYDFYIALDSGKRDRVNTDQFELNPKIPLIVIDHHIDNPRYGDKNYIYPLSATAEIILRGAQAAKMQISAEASTQLLLGIISDTGFYRFSNTTEQTFESVMFLYHLKADSAKVINELCFSKPLNQMQFESDVFLNHFATHENGRIGTLYVSQECLKRHQIDIRNLEGLVDLPRSIQHVEIAILIIEQTMGQYKLSYRSKNQHWPVGPAARRLGGGGHEMAAGVTIFAQDEKTAIQVAIAEVLKEKE